MRYLVEMCTFHGPTRQRRWHRVHQGIFPAWNANAGSKSWWLSSRLKKKLAAPSA